MLSKAEIGRILGVTRMQAGRLVKQGCPQTTPEEVLEWRRLNPHKRAPTVGNRKEEAKPNTPQKKVVEKSVRQKVEQGEEDPVEPRQKPKKMKKVNVKKTGDSLLDALNNAIYVADKAFEEYMMACENNLPTRSLRLSEHNKALDGRLKAERSYREELERREVLVDKHEVLQTARVAIEAVLRSLKRFPQEIGPQCNPDNPMMATKVLEREVAGVIATGAKEIHGLRG